MKLYPVVLGLALAAIHAVQPAAAYTNPIVIKNYKMYDAKTGKYFGVRGVDYYPRPNAGELNKNNLDLFTDDYESVWKPDLARMAALGANAIRLYAVNPSDSVSHDKFMCTLRSYGMYALIDFGAECEGCAITKDASPACYPPTLKARGQMIINKFARYDNVLAFSAGNEINHVADDVTDNAPCQKKFIRDMRAYIGRCASKLRQVPVGVVLADSGGERELNAKYYNCRTDASDKYENAEWYGLNVYQHCDGSVTDVAKAGGFQKLLTDFDAYKMNVPVMLTEFGCLNPSFPTVDGYDAQRTWLQAGWIHSKTFRQQLNGGFVFEYSTELANSKSTSPWPFTSYGPQNYGLGYFTPKDCDHVDTKCTFVPMPNYHDLAEQYNATDYSDEPLKDAFTPDSDKLEYPACPAEFKALSDISWTDVEAVTLSCPSYVQEHTCSGQVSSGSWVTVGDSDSEDDTDTPSTTKTPTTTKTPGSTGTGSPTGSSTGTTNGSSNGSSSSSSSSGTTVAYAAAACGAVAVLVVVALVVYRKKRRDALDSEAAEGGAEQDCYQVVQSPHHATQRATA